MKRVLFVPVLLSLVACASWPSGTQARLLAQADRMAANGDYAAALGAYDDMLSRYPDGDVADRARAGREAVAGLLMAREEVARLREQLLARESEVTRLRQELARLTAEADRLKADLERIKQLDLKLERRR